MSQTIEDLKQEAEIKRQVEVNEYINRTSAINKDKEISEDQQEVNELAQQIQGLTPDIINSVFSGKRLEGMNFMVYKALRKTLADKTNQYLKGKLEFVSKDIRKQVIKSDDNGNKTLVYTGDVHGTKLVRGTTYVKSKNKGE